MKRWTVIVGSTAFFVYYLFHLSFGIHLDELLFIDLGASLVRGMRLVVENYSPYQLCELLQFPFMKVFHLLKGDFTGIVIYMRYVYAGIQLLIAVYLYISLRARSERLALVIAAMHFLYRYHWPTINYKALLYWGTVILSISLYNYVHSDKRRYLIAAAVGLIFAVFGNPYAVILYFPAVIALYRLKERKKARYAACLITLICVSAGLLLILTLAGIGGWNRFWHCLPWLFGDGTSQHGLASPHRITRLILPITFLGTAENLAVFGVDRLAAGKGKKLPWEKMLSVVFLVSLLVICAVRIRSAGPSRFWYILLAVFLLAPFWYRRSERSVREKREILYLTLLPSCFMMGTAILSTNQGIAVVAYGCEIGLCGLVMLNWRENRETGVNSSLCRLILTMLLFMAVFYVPEDGAANILQKRIRVTEGPLRGVYVNEDIYEISSKIVNVVEEHTDQRDRLLIIANPRESMIGQVASRAGFGVRPGGIGGSREAVDSGRNLLLYEMNPKRKPTVVVINRSYMDRVSWLSDTDFWDYIRSNYSETESTDENYLILHPAGE